MFENFIVTEIHRLLSYKEHQFRLSYLRVSDSQEIDLIIELGDSVAFVIVIKSTDNVNERHAANLALFEKDFPNAKFRLISQDKHPKQYGAVLALPWQQAIAEIFSA
jgi:predicted AAA+ superfamily ATPase